MSKKRFGRPRLQARPKHYKQAGAVEEALRCRGVIAHVKPSWTGSLIVQVADPDAASGYLDAHATAMADALFADSVSITSGLRDFIVAPEWRGPDDGDEVENEDAWPPTDDPEPASDESAAAPAAPEGLSAVDALDAFLHGYKMGAAWRARWTTCAAAWCSVARGMTVATSCVSMRPATRRPSARKCAAAQLRSPRPWAPRSVGSKATAA